ncbi:MAG: electron transfer flavoprotein subunit alpha/FixB family protein [Chloroflexi bacterium]|nr:electron transfer flavoprotein subunit alpha/FixB family protein [Chloroflexota bacterium]
MPADILIYVEHEAGQPRRLALELASRAADLASASGGKVAAVALGAGAAAAAERLGQYGVSEVYVNESEVFDQYLTDPHVDLLGRLVGDMDLQAMLFPYTADGKDIASRLAARLQSGLVANVVDLEPHDGHVDASETIFGGNYVTTVEVRNSRIPIFLIRPNAFSPMERPGAAAVRQVEYSPADTAMRARTGNKVQEEGAPTPVDEASIIISGGRGLGGPEPFALLEDLARAIGGVVGASRAAVDAGWISYAHQVGQTGRTVKPQLYIAVGISGAVQHRVGMQTADTIVAINKDPDAPIFQLADLAVVGDLFQVVPALTEEVKKRKGE